MLILLACFVTTSLANNHEKRIDLLRNVEKEEFLNSDRRRILETVDNINNITDEDLERHKLVQDILKIKPVPTRKHKEYDRNIDDENNESRRSNDKPLNLQKTTTINSENSQKVSEIDNISVSIDKMTRRSSDDTVNESFSDYIKVEIVTENELRIRKRSINEDGASYVLKNNVRNKKSLKEEIQNLRVKESYYNSPLTYENETEYKIPEHSSKALKKDKSSYEYLKNKAKPKIQNKFESHASLKSHQVYEVSWPKPKFHDEKPLLKSPETKKHRPNTIAGYKDSPSYKYYNIHNTIVSNPIEENRTEVDRIFLVEGKKEGERLKRKEVLNATKELRKFGKCRNDQEIYTVEPAFPSKYYKDDEDPLEEKQNAENSNNYDEGPPSRPVLEPTTTEYIVENSPEAQDINDLLEMDHINNNVITNLSGNKSQTPVKENGKKDNDNFNTIAKIISVTDEKDVFINLEKLQQMKLKLTRRNEDVKVGIYMKVLKDLIDQDSNALRQYDWLTTTVQIQSALEKLFRIIDRKRNLKPLHPADIQILEYAIFNHDFSLELKLSNGLKGKFRKMEQVDIDKIVAERRILNRIRLYLRTLLPDSPASSGLNKFNEFLLNIEDTLKDLHEAITYIAKITTFKHQNWFGNIKELYLTSNEKHVRELLLHISFARLIDLIEVGCENGLEKDFRQYMKTHKKESKRTLEEFLFMLKVLDEIKSDLE